MNQKPRKPSGPTPEDPSRHEPIHDPPVDPEHDIGEDEPVRQAGGEKAPDPAPDQVVFDAEESER